MLVMHGHKICHFLLAILGKLCSYYYMKASLSALDS